MTTGITGVALRNDSPQGGAASAARGATLRTGRRSIALLTTLALTGAGIASIDSAAHAASEDARIVLTKAHVDSPKTFWQNGSLELLSEKGDSRNPVEHTINYVPKAYSRDGGQQYMFTVPSEAPELGFLGKAGKTWWSAPQDLTWDAQLWAGFGADTAVPTEKFRDAVFSLDMIDVEGPGKVEMFFWRSRPGYGDVDRFYSSHDPAFRSTPLKKGSHNHMYALFSKPGRYRITYRATARDLQGNLIASHPAVAEWQVGGGEPSGASAPALAKRFAGLDSSKAPASYTFSVADAGDKVDAADAPVADKLTRWSFDAGTPVDGTASVLVDGFHMADVPVKGGQGELVQLPATDSARYQLVFRPEGGGAAWASKEVTYSHGGTAKTSAADGSAPVATPKPDADAPERLSGEVTGRAQAPFTATITPDKKFGEQSTAQVKVDFGDAAVRGFVKIGFYDKDSKYPTAEWSGPVDDGVLNQRMRVPATAAGLRAVMTFAPHATMKQGAASTNTLTEVFDPAKPVTARGVLGGEAPAPTATATTPAPGTATPTPTGTSTTESRLVLDQGHVDLQVRLMGAAFSMALKDDTGIGDAESVSRPVDSVALAVRDTAKVKREGELAASSWDFLGPQGSTVHLLPITQQSGLIWPGYSTENVSFNLLKGPVQLHIRKVSGPGEVKLFQPAGIGGGATVTYDSADPAKQDITIPGAAHVHQGWVFTKPGVYDLDVNYTATHIQGMKLDSGTKTLRFLVGDAAINGATESTPTSTGTAPAPTATTPAPTSTATTPAPTSTGTTPAPTSTSAPAPTSTTSPSPTATAPTTPAPGKATLVLDRGHADVFDVVGEGGLPVLRLAEDTTGSHATHRPEDVTLRVPASALLDIPAGFPGAPRAYLLPLTQQPDLLWPGWNTLGSRSAGFGPIDIVVSDVQGPGQVALFSQDFAGRPQSLLTGGGMTLPGTIRVASPAHVHANWAFTKPGTYRMTVKAVTTKDGRRVESAPATYTWVVGDAATTPAPTATTTTPAPAPTTIPPVVKPGNPSPVKPKPAPAKPKPAPAKPKPAPAKPKPKPTKPKPKPTKPKPAPTKPKPKPKKPVKKVVKKPVSKKPVKKVVKKPVPKKPVKKVVKKPVPKKPVKKVVKKKVVRTTGPRRAAVPAVTRKPVAKRPAILSLTKGHMDLFYLKPVKSGVDLFLREDVTGVGVLRKPELTRVLVNDTAKMRVPQGLPEAGRTAYVLPMTQNPRLPWPGWNTEMLRASRAKSAAFDVSVSGPGRVSIFTTGFLGKVNPVLDRKRLALPGRITVPSPAHVHANWIFSAPGTYTLKVKGTSGGKSTRVATYTIVVGNAAIKRLK